MHTDARQTWNTAFSRPDPPMARCPYDFVASFLFRYSPGEPVDTSVLELGFGGGANLWFAARQGFRIAGVDVSDRALEVASRLLEQDRLTGELRRSEFFPLPFQDQAFDLVFDRGSLSTVSAEAVEQAVAEVRRVLRPGGKFLFNPFSTIDSSSSGPPELEPGVRDRTPWAGGGDVSFYDREDIERLFASDWRLCELVHVVEVDELVGESSRRAEWRAVVELLSA